MLPHRSGLGVLAPLMTMIVGTCPGVPAQCATQWLPGGGLPNVNGNIRASTMWDRDGAGPVPPVLVVAGYFSIVGTMAANAIASYDPATGALAPLGAGLGPPGVGSVNALAVLSNGDLVAGGSFPSAGGVSAQNVARWNGTNWSALGPGVGSEVKALAVLATGDLVAGGTFLTAGGANASRIARWNGASWSPLGSGMDDAVYSLAVLANGDLVAGGLFAYAGGTPADKVARWNGTTWSAMGPGINGAVYALTTLSNGDLVAGGLFTWAGGVPANNIARWTGGAWVPMASGVDATVNSLATLANGNLVAGGAFTTAGGTSAQHIASWNGSTWSPLGPGVTAAALTVTRLGNGAVAGGSQFLLRWNGTRWAPMAAGVDAGVHALLNLPNGDIVAAGSFSVIGGVSANFLARWNGVSWSPLGSGLNAAAVVTALPNGDVVAGGWFTVAGGVSVNYIARWNGSSWSPLGAGFDLPVWCLTTLPNGDVVAGGSFTNSGGVPINHVARWDGTNWSALGAGLNDVVGVAALADGTLVAATFSPPSSSSVWLWNGTSWSSLGSFYAPMYSLAALPEGGFAVGFGATFGVGGRVFTWKPTTSWSQVGASLNSDVRSVTAIPGGGIIASGLFTEDTSGSLLQLNRIARWIPGSWPGWVPLGAGLSPMWATAFAMKPDGDLLVGGYFTFADNLFSPYLAALTTTCPASAVSAGSGCTGAGGPNVLTATTLPWTGTTFRAMATGMPNNALALGVLGLAPATTPLSTILPQGVPGCTLLVSPLVLDLHVTTGGSLPTQFVIPNSAALANRVFHHQLVPIETDTLGNITALTSTNALTVTIGVF
ncbi:MAG: hypothetical protein WBO45_16265 [Planctomycetota bacterium]